nr:MAG TPA: hypothetical protein [Caudoviricetes sp.]
MLRFKLKDVLLSQFGDKFGKKIFQYCCSVKCNADTIAATSSVSGLYLPHTILDTLFLCQPIALENSSCVPYTATISPFNLCKSNPFTSDITIW